MKELNKVKIRVWNESRWVLFQPSNYLSDESKIWTLIHLVNNDERFVKELKLNNFIIDGSFIEKIVEKINLPFYLSKDEDCMFAAPLEIHEQEHGPLQKITAKQALSFLSVPALERVIEQGSSKLK